MGTQEVQDMSFCHMDRDGDHDEFGEHNHLSSGGHSEETEIGNGPASYAPTNGTKSSGDIYYFGPGIGFN